MTTTLSLIAFFWLNNQSAEPASHNSHIIRYCFDMIVLLLCGYAFMQLLKSCYLFNVAQTWKKRPFIGWRICAAAKKIYAAILQTEIMCRSLGLQIGNSSIIEDKSILRVRWKWRSSFVLLLQILCIYSSYLVLLVRGSFSNC